MNAEKEVTISELKAKFVKEFDNGGKMNPYLEFTVGKQSARTENLEAGKELVWNDSVVLTYFDETHIAVKAYDDDGSERECMGGGKLQIKSLRFPGGMIEANLATDNGEVLCSLTGKYTIKNMNACPLLLIKNAKLDLIREDKQISKAKPYISFTAEEQTLCTEVKEQISGCSINWSDCIRLKVKEGSKLLVEMLDKNGTSTPLFSYECSLKQFRCQHGSKRVNVSDRNFNQLGQLHFDYETVNLVSKEESVKNQDKQKKSQNELTAITIQKLVLDITKQNVEVYAKVIVGCNCSRSEIVRSSNGVEVPIKGCLYAESRDNKVVVTIWQLNVIKDELLGSGCVYLDSLQNGQNSITLTNDKEDRGIATLCVNTSSVPCKTLTLSTISVSVSEEGDIIGNNEPFLKATVGCCSGRTQTGNQGKFTFKKPVQLKFGKQQSICLEIWDQDVASNTLLYSQDISLSSLKAKGDHSLTITKPGQQGQPEKKGKISFKYQFKSSGSQSPSRKPTVKMTEVSKKDPPKESHTQRSDIQSGRNKKNSVPSQSDMNDNITINRSKETLNLPSIIGSINHHAYGDRIFDRQSAATLQKSIVAFSMPKADRFNHGPKYTGEPSYCIDTCFKKNQTKGAGFGFGRKKQFPDWMERNMKENPAPGAYFEGDHDLRNRGPTFGLSHKYYERVMIPREKKSVGGHTIARKLSPIRDPTPK